jgi:hypothetical protein
MEHYVQPNGQWLAPYAHRWMADEPSVITRSIADSPPTSLDSRTFFSTPPSPEAPVPSRSPDWRCIQSSSGMALLTFPASHMEVGLAPHPSRISVWLMQPPPPSRRRLPADCPRVAGRSSTCPGEACPTLQATLPRSIVWQSMLVHFTPRKGIPPSQIAHRAISRARSSAGDRSGGIAPSAEGKSGGRNGQSVRKR